MTTPTPKTGAAVLSVSLLLVATLAFGYSAISGLLSIGRAHGVLRMAIGQAVAFPCAALAMWLIPLALPRMPRALNVLRIVSIVTSTAAFAVAVAVMIKAAQR